MTRRFLAVSRFLGDAEWPVERFEAEAAVQAKLAGKTIDGKFISEKVKAKLA